MKPLRTVELLIAITALFGLALCSPIAAQGTTAGAPQEKAGDILTKSYDTAGAAKQTSVTSPTTAQETEKAPERESRQPEKRDNLVEVYESYKARVVNGLKKLAAGVRGIPTSYRQLKMYLSEKQHREEFISFGIKFVLSLFVACLVWLLLRKYTRKVEDTLKATTPAGLGRKMGEALVRTFFATYPWIGLYLFTYLFLWLVPLDKHAAAIIVWIFFAFIPYFAVKNLLYRLCAPRDSTRRVFPMTDGTAHYVAIWSQRILLFSLWLYILIAPTVVLKKPGLTATLAAIYKIGLVIMLAMILAQWKDRIQQLLSLPVEDRLPGWQRTLRRAVNFLAGKLYLIAIVYMGFLAALSILGFSGLSRILLYGALETIVVLAVAATAWSLWNFFIRRLFLVTTVMRDKFPDVEDQVNRYVNYLERTGEIIIGVLTAFTVADLWGLNIYGWLSAHGDIVEGLLRIPLIIVLAVVFVRVAYFLIDRLENHARGRMLAASGAAPIEVEKRVSTLGRIFRRTVVVIVVVITGMMVLAEIGFDIKPVLAGAGIIGLAVGFGAQNLVRDVISGLFLIVENRIRVGDVAIINGTGGLVEQVNLRTTVLRGLDGTIHVFPNGAIDTLSNMTHEYSYYLFEVGVAYKEDTDRVVEVLKELSDEITQDPDYAEFILEPLEILGVDKFADSAVVIKARIKTLPIKQWFVGREMNRRIKKRFDELGIEIPFPHQSLYFGEASKPISIKLEGLAGQREELKQLIREVMTESR